jgi:hypothetical protein
VRELSDGRWFQGLLEEMRQVRGLPGVLDAAYRVFEVMLTVAREHEDPDGGMFASFVFAAGSAANGRDAVASALSLPPAGPASEGLTVETGSVVDAEEAADGLAILGEALNGLLMAAGRAAGDVRDQVACARAAGHAREVHALLVGG